MSLTVALTGATGFVGKALLPLLLDAGHKVRALARDPARIAAAPGLAVIKGDLAAGEALADLVNGADTVLHVAGAISALRPEDFFRINVQGTKAVAQAAMAAGVRRFVHVSSLAARRPEVSPYAASKRAAEDWLLAAARDLSVLALRPAAIYGEGDEATRPLLAAMLSRVAILPGSSTGRFSLIHVDDFARICVDALNSPAAGLREVDDTGKGYGWPDMTAIMRGNFGRPGTVINLPRGVAMALGHAGDVWSRLSGKPAMLSSAKMREFYQPEWVVSGEGWPRPTPILLAEGLPRAVRWYQARGLLPQTEHGVTSAASGRR